MVDQCPKEPSSPSHNLDFFYTKRGEIQLISANFLVQESFVLVAVWVDLITMFLYTSKKINAILCSAIFYLYVKGKCCTFKHQSPKNRLSCLFQAPCNILFRRYRTSMTQHRQQSSKVRAKGIDPIWNHICLLHTFWIFHRNYTICNLLGIMFVIHIILCIQTEMCT